MGKRKRKTPISESVAPANLPRSTPRTPAQPTQVPGRSSVPKTKALSVVAKVWRSFVAVIVTAITILGALTMYPRFSITAGDPLVEGALLSVPMEISYDGIIPLRNVQARCDINYVFAPPWIIEGVVMAERDIADWITPGDKFAMGCYSRYRAMSVTMPTIQDGEIEASVTYQPLGLPFRLTKTMLLATEGGKEGATRWSRIGPRDRMPPPQHTDKTVLVTPSDPENRRTRPRILGPLKIPTTARPRLDSSTPKPPQ